MLLKICPCQATKTLGENDFLIFLACFFKKLKLSRMLLYSYRINTLKIFFKTCILCSIASYKAMKIKKQSEYQGIVTKYN